MAMALPSNIRKEIERIEGRGPFLDLGVGSHAPVLAAIVARCFRRYDKIGPPSTIWEFGCGDYSTPLLHLMARERGAVLVSFETDEMWLRKYASLANLDYPTAHRFEHVLDWEEIGARPGGPNLLFIDCSPGEIRVPLALAFKDRAQIIICHDTEADIPPAAGNYGWAKLDGVFKHQWTCKLWRPWTTVYSNCDLGFSF